MKRYTYQCNINIINVHCLIIICDTILAQNLSIHMHMLKFTYYLYALDVVLIYRYSFSALRLIFIHFKGTQHECLLRQGFVGRRELFVHPYTVFSCKQYK